MNTAAALLAASLMWPFGGDEEKDPPPRPGTLGSLQERKVELPPEPGVDQANQRARESYEEFLRQPQSDPRLAAEAMRRLADLELENAELAGDGAAQAASYRKAANLYRELLARYPADAGNDQVLYQLARAQESLGDNPAALTALGQMVQQFPRSPLLIEAQFRRGELLFAQRRYADADGAYAAVVSRGPDTPYFESALYKRGWSQFKQDEHQASLDLFFQLLDRRLGKVPESALEAHFDAMPRPEQELVDDSLRAMALACLNLGSPRTVAEQLARHGDPVYGYRLYQSLAAIYLKQERYSDAAAAFTGFAETHPLHAQAPAFQMQAVAALEAGGFSSQALALRQDYVRRFGLDQAFWKQRQPQAAGSGAALDYLRESTWMLAQQHHALAQDGASTPAQRDTAAASAAEDYRRYVRYFPQDARTPQAQYLLGDLLYDTGDLPAAIEAYEAAAYAPPGFERSADAGYAALQAYQKHEAQLEGEARDTWRLQRLQAELRFAEHFPQRKESAAVRSKAAAGLFEAGQAAPAVGAAERVTADPQADRDSRRVAWRVIGHASFDRQDYARAEQAYREVQALGVPGEPPDRDIAERLAASIYRQGEQARAAGQALQAAGHFSRVADAAPDTGIRTTADYDAAMATLKAGQAARAIPMLLAFRERNAGNPLVAEVTRTLALTYEKNQQPREAATELLRIAETPGGDPQLQREALWHSAELLQPVDTLGAERSLRLYVERYPEPFDAAIEAQQKLIELASARGDTAAQAQWSQRLLNFEAAGGERRSQRSRALASRAALLQAQAARDAYRGVALSLPLKASLATKRKRLEEALAAYARAADYGVAEVLTESTFETAELYHDLARALKQSERPRELDAAALEQYDLLLDEQIFPFEDKAITIHEANARRAREGLYDPWVQKSFAELAGLAPGRYRKPELSEPSVPAASAGTPVAPEAAQAFETARAALEAGDGAAAESAFKALAAAYPALPGAAVNLGLAYRLLNHPVDEEASLSRAAEKWPQFAPAQHQLALWLQRRGRFAEADAAYASAIAADARYGAAHYNRGVLNDLYLQRPDQALAAYEQYQKLLPEADAQVARWITDLRRRAGTAPATETPS